VHLPVSPGHHLGDAVRQPDHPAGEAEGGPISGAGGGIHLILTDTNVSEEETDAETLEESLSDSGTEMDTEDDKSGI
jgi:hypothetical protein